MKQLERTMHGERERERLQMTVPKLYPSAGGGEEKRGNNSVPHVPAQEER